MRVQRGKEGRLPVGRRLQVRVGASTGQLHGYVELTIESRHDEGTRSVASADLIDVRTAIQQSDSRLQVTLTGCEEQRGHATGLPNQRFTVRRTRHVRATRVVRSVIDQLFGIVLPVGLT